MNGPIVVGTDGSQTAAAAVRAATTLAKTFGQPLHVVCSSPSPSAADGLAFTAGATVLKASESWVQEVLDDAATQIRLSNVDVVTHAKVGGPADAILDVADEVSADLIVVGNRGIDSKSRFILGNVPSRVVHHATCSTYVVNTTKRT
jgi:nucleotide-binding universal stress UspA family protein